MGWWRRSSRAGSETARAENETLRAENAALPGEVSRPANARLAPDAGGRAKVVWDSPARSASSCRDYRVRLTGPNGDVIATRTVHDHEVDLTDSMTSGGVFIVAVAAVVDGAVGPFCKGLTLHAEATNSASTPVVRSVDKGKRPGLPRNIQWNRRDGEVIVSWDPPHRFADVPLQYEVGVRKFGTYEVDLTVVNELMCVLPSSLKPGKLYEVTVRAVDNGRRGRFTEPVEIRVTRPRQDNPSPPTRPIGVSAHETEGAVLVRWRRPQRPQAGNLEYVVRLRPPDGSGFIDLEVGDALECDISANMNPGVTYEVRVRAVSGDLKGEFSQPAYAAATVASPEELRMGTVDADLLGDAGTRIAPLADGEPNQVPGVSGTRRAPLLELPSESDVGSP